MISKINQSNSQKLWLLVIIALWFITGVPGTIQSASKEAAMPNIIVFLVDDMGIMDTSVPFLTDSNGVPKKYPLNEFYRTPGMERLAEKGIRFNQFYAQSVCSPTRASIMTGQNATRHGTTQFIRPHENNRGDMGPPEWNWEGLKKGDVTLPLVLGQAGYRTIHIGKAHFGPLGHEGSDPTNLGFDVNVGGASWGRPKSYYSEDHYGNHPKYKGNMSHNVPDLEEYYDTGTYLTEALTLEARELIRKSVADKKPFFLHMAHYAVHAPFHPDPRFIDNYRDSGKSKATNAFASMIEGMDKSLNDLLNQLEALGIADNTLVIFLGDNGTDAPLGDQNSVVCAAPLRGKKGTRFEGGMRVPFIAAWAKADPANLWQQKLPIQPNVVQDQLGTVMDIFPTILDLLQIETPDGHMIDGFSLKELYRGAEDPTKPEMFLMHFPHSHRNSYFTSFRFNGWKVVYHYFGKISKRNEAADSDLRYELYNLEEDPFEQNNLAESNPEKLTSMMRQMIAQLEVEGALYPVQDGKVIKPRLP